MAPSGNSTERERDGERGRERDSHNEIERDRQTEWERESERETGDIQNEPTVAAVQRASEG